MSSKKMKVSNEVVYAVAEGKLLSLSKVKDETFSKEMMGKGYAIIPTSKAVYSPVTGKVVSVFSTKHAITILSDNGSEIIVHVGIDTIETKGEYFDAHVKEGDKVKVGTKLISFDLEKLEQEKYDMTIPVVILNTKDYEVIDMIEEDEVSLKDKVLTLEAKENAEVTITENVNNNLTDSIVKYLGGANNIKTIEHCATRLRVNLVDEKLLNEKELEKTPGVLGVVHAMGGVQIIIGNSVNNVYQTIISTNKIDTASTKKEKKGNIFNNLLNVLSAILGPVIPLIMTSGLISSLLIIMKMAGLSETSGEYILLQTAANAIFYFLPVLVGYTSAKRFNCNPVYGIFVGGLLLHPTIMGLFGVEPGISFLGIPVIALDYSSSLIPSILGVWILSYVEKLVDKYLPNAVKFVLKPLLIILIMLPITICVAGPLGIIVGSILANFISFVHAQASWLALIISAALAPVMVMTGMHLAFMPLIFENFAKFGYDNFLFVSFIGMNFSQFAVALAVMLKTKNSSLRQLAGSSALTAFLCGVTEPTLFGITIRLKKPLVATFIGCIASAVFCAIVGVKVFAFGAPSFFTMPIFINPDGTTTNLMFATIAVIITIVVTFVATWVLGFDDSIYEENKQGDE